MKKLLTLTAFFLGISAGIYAQEYTDKLKETFHAFNATQDYQEKVNQSNRLNLIAKKYSQDWVPAYYAGFSKVVLSYEEKDAAKKDAYLDDADLLIEQATTLAGKPDDELYVLTAMAANARLAVDPQKRWKKYGKIFEENLEKAKALNEENPRIYYLKGTSLFYTPKMFGGGKKNAQPYFEKAAGYFEKEDISDINNPSWGKEINAYFLGECKKED